MSPSRTWQLWRMVGIVALAPMVLAVYAIAATEGDTWPTIREQRKQRWCFQPIGRPQPPEVEDTAWSDHPVDRFILARLESRGLKPAPSADRRALVRRLHFALIGLPPSLDELDQFSADDSPDAYGKLVDRLLDSPHFGERWARHWMDWFRYAETHGSEGDPWIPNAWRYRDYLIRALNADVPYDQLVREHLAGDLLPNPRIDHERQINESALGIGHLRFVEHGYAPTDPLEELVRTTDNQIDVVSKAFLSVTVSCARCHDHKFDPISQRDFYAWYGIFTGCRPAQITVDTPQRLRQHADRLQELKAAVQAEVGKAWRAALHSDSVPLAQQLAAAPTPSPPELRKNKEARQKWSAWQRRINEAADAGPTHPLYPLLQMQNVTAAQVDSRWREITLGWRESLARLEQRRRRPYALHWDLASNDAAGWLAHGAAFLEQQPAAAGEFHVATDGEPVIAQIYPAGFFTHRHSTKHGGALTSPSFAVTADELWIRVLGRHARARYAMQHYPRVAGPIYQSHALNHDQFRWVRWDLKYWQGDRAYVELATSRDIPVEAGEHDRSWFGVAEVIARDEGQPAPQDEPAEFTSPLFEIAAGQVLSSREQLGQWYVRAVRHSVDAWLGGDMADAEARFLSYFVREQLLPNTLMELPAIESLLQEYRQLESDVPVPTRAPGMVEAESGDQRLLVRGNHKEPAALVRRGFLEALDPAPFQTRDSGRLQLALAIADDQNPLTSRVMVNRVWHHLFGRGLVRSVDNFGHLGDDPTHPLLLDYLADGFIRDGYSVKRLLRRLVTSQTYQLSTTSSAAARQRDPQNLWLSHARVQRLDAETIRDALLAVSGQLDRAALGVSVGVDVPRRSVYLKIARNSPHPFLAAFDAPAPFSTKGRRDVTNVPAQSLTMMNDPFVNATAEEWAERILGDESLVDEHGRLVRVFRMALGRPPTAAEIAASLAYIEQVRSAADATDAWVEFLQAVLALKEFIYLR